MISKYSSGTARRIDWSNFHFERVPFFAYSYFTVLFSIFELKGNNNCFLVYSNTNKDYLSINNNLEQFTYKRKIQV